jgi:hypothetical protein
VIFLRLPAWIFGESGEGDMAMVNVYVTIALEPKLMALLIRIIGGDDEQIAQLTAKLQTSADALKAAVAAEGQKSNPQPRHGG